MSRGSSLSEWTYLWMVPSSVTTGSYEVTVAATSTNGNPYPGGDSLNLTIDPVFYLDDNGVTIKCSNCSVI